MPETIDIQIVRLRERVTRLEAYNKIIMTLQVAQLGALMALIFKTFGG